MRTKANLILLVLCACCFALGFYFIKELSSEPISSTPLSAGETPAKFKNPRARAAEKQNLNSQTKTIYVTNSFNWSQVESADYREYIANLRGIGCPEATIKDIVITDIMRLYAARRGQFYHNGRDFKFWETNEKRKLNARQLEEREKQLALIDKEIPAVLRELLGVNYEREINKYFVDSNEDERRLNFVSEDKRNRLLALREEIEGRREKLKDDMARGKISAEQQSDELQKIEEVRRAALVKILSPAELDEFELRTSETANRLRDELIGFNPSEEEFRQLYFLQKALDEKSATGAADEADLEKMKGQIRELLGETRFADLERARNPDYRDACLFSQLYELPDSTAGSIFEIKQIAEREKLSLLANQEISADRRNEALQAIRTETEKSLLQILGTKLLSSYTQSSGRWVQQLETPN